MFQKLEAVEKRYEELTIKISDPEVIANQTEWRGFMKERIRELPVSADKEREVFCQNCCIKGIDTKELPYNPFRESSGPEALKQIQCLPVL